MTLSTPILTKIFYFFSLVAIAVGLYQGVFAMDDFGLQGFVASSISSIFAATAFAAIGSILYYLSNILDAQLLYIQTSKTAQVAHDSSSNSTNKSKYPYSFKHNEKVIHHDNSNYLVGDKTFKSSEEAKAYIDTKA